MCYKRDGSSNARKHGASETSRAWEVRRVMEPRLAERGVRLSDVGDPSTSALPRPRLGRRMLRLLELFLH